MAKLLLAWLDKFPPAVTALVLQCAAFVGMVVVARFSVLKFSAITFALGCGLVALGLSHAARLAKWWQVLQFLFAPALVMTLALKIQPLYFLAGFLVLWLVYWNTFKTQVPLYLSSTKVWHALGCLLPPPDPENRFQFADIGSGLGGVLTHLADVRPDGDYFGVESAPIPFLWSWLRIRLGGYRQCRIQWGDLWGCDLAAFDVVFAYLSPAPMERLWRKAKTEMKPGSVFISSTFSVPGQIPAQTVLIDDLHRSSLLIWKM